MAGIMNIVTTTRTAMKKESNYESLYFSEWEPTGEKVKKGEGYVYGVD